MVSGVDQALSLGAARPGSESQASSLLAVWPGKVPEACFFTFKWGEQENMYFRVIVRNKSVRCASFSAAAHYLLDTIILPS